MTQKIMKPFNGKASIFAIDAFAPLSDCELRTLGVPVTSLFFNPVSIVSLDHSQFGDRSEPLITRPGPVPAHSRNDK